MFLMTVMHSIAIQEKELLRHFFRGRYIAIKKMTVQSSFVNPNFVDEESDLKATIAGVDDVLSGQEQKNICRFTREMGPHYCEVDVLRDRDDERIYIVDANNTPSGPPSPISDHDEKIAVARLAGTFEKAFSA